MTLKTYAQMGLYCSTHVAQNEVYENSIFHYDKSILLLSLFENGEFNLVLSLSAGDHHSDKQLSFGSFTRVDKVLFLYDELFDFVMQMEIENDTCLKSTNGLSIMKGMHFMFSGTATIPSYSYNGIKQFLFENRNSTSKADTTSNFPKGKYMDQPFGGYELDLFNDGRYEYNVEGFLISKGKWEKNNHLLVFYDDGMSLPYYACIDNSGNNVFLAIGNPRCFPLSISNVPFLNGFYSTKDSSAATLHLHDGKYTLEFELSESGIGYNKKISSGSYVFDSDFITLHDDLLEYETRIRIVSRTELMFLGQRYNGLKYKSFYWSKPSKSMDTFGENGYRFEQKICNIEYEIDINSNQVDCEMIINSDQTYEIRLCFQATEDMVNCAVLSYGHYSTTNESLYLHDDFYNYDWELSLINNAVSIGSGYAFLNGRAILNYRNETVKVLPPNDDYLAKIKAQTDMFINSQNNPRLVAGQYEDQNHGYLLRIKDIGRYQLYLKDVLLSEGDWGKQDNILVLHDVHLNHDFKIAIGNGSLMSLGFPGEFGGTKLTLIKTKTNNSNHETKTSPNNRRGGCSKVK